VCDDLSSALRAIRFVKERNLGRTMVLAGSLCRSEKGPVLGVRPRVGDLSSCAPEHAEWVAGLLGRTFVVPSGRVAEILLRAGVGPSVTPEGEVFHPNGLLTTGTRSGVGILSRKTELRSLELEIEDYDRMVAEREARRVEMESRTKATEETLEYLRQRIYEQTIARHDAAAREEQLGSRVAFLAQELETARVERGQLLLQKAALEERSVKIHRLLSELEELKRRVDAELVELNSTGTRYEVARRELTDRLTHAKVERAKVEEKRAAVEKRIEMMNGSLREVQDALRRFEARRQEIAGRIESVRQEIERRRAERESLAAEIEGKRAWVLELESEKSARTSSVEEARQAGEAATADHAACSSEIQELRIEEGEQRVKLEGHLARARDEQGIDLRETSIGCTDEEGVDWPVLGTEVDELRRKVMGFGAVNVEALSLLQDLETREKQILAQEEDLTKTKGELTELIQKLNRESQELFTKTLGVVREHFNAIFRKLFGGGKADIAVEEEPGIDPMDQGLQILARPPAKDFTTISLLSGGERSLTALALVMALFKANPSPFCILDEADAALDEKNVERYAGLVTEFVEETQFIVITHNKRTMAVADVMYGVTMETPGVSKKVAVELNGDDGLELLREKRKVVMSSEV